VVPSDDASRPAAAGGGAVERRQPAGVHRRDRGDAAVCVLDRCGPVAGRGPDRARAGLRVARGPATPPSSWRDEADGDRRGGYVTSAAGGSSRAATSRRSSIAGCRRGWPR
jgi:hypothetical protein